MKETIRKTRTSGDKANCKDAIWPKAAGRKAGQVERTGRQVGVGGMGVWAAASPQSFRNSSPLPLAHQPASDNLVTTSETTRHNTARDTISQSHSDSLHVMRIGQAWGGDLKEEETAFSFHQTDSSRKLTQPDKWKEEEEEEEEVFEMELASVSMTWCQMQTQKS
ncbi:hypothetical protein E2C01_003068 [Portunus trituberculatus]|uniref:Uncharacterized protein n=1 Tax=Portunus trituberculatus TaxID=210409 RepID=A0A5B7CL69_PORTR|nr:hypothetical protein [Portunus trituberculatus]